ncbi:MAG: hypothetical protein KH230_20445 [Enterocloster asparagiformis]|nr:hypothetical protein [Enterocloster asparagiformis]
MARRVRKTTLEKLNEELVQVEEALEQYKSCMETLKDKERQLREQIEMEELKSIMELLKNQNMNVNDLKTLINSYACENNTIEQSA